MEGGKEKRGRQRRTGMRRGSGACCREAETAPRKEATGREGKRRVVMVKVGTLVLFLTLEEMLSIFHH